MTATRTEAPVEIPPVPLEPEPAPAADGGPPPATRAGIYGALSSVSVSAARERTRLQRTARRVGPVALALRLGLGLRYLGTAQAATRGLRYRPVAWSIIAIVALAFFLPGRVDWSSSPTPFATPSPVAVAPPNPSPEGAPDATADQPAVSAPSPSNFEAPAPSPAPPSVPNDPGVDAPAPPPPPTAGPDPVVAPTDDGVTVRGYGWASRLSPNPLRGTVPVDEVAEGTAPVGMRLGFVDKVTFLRLDGAATTLELTEHPDSAREPLEPAAIAICPILDDDWAEAGQQSFDDAPEWDEESCVAGVENDDQWSFDLSSFLTGGDDEYADIVGDRGFALVPTDEAPPEFSIAFEMPDDLVLDEI